MREGVGYFWDYSSLDEDLGERAHIVVEHLGPG